ncbi:hypothetical protein [Streptomyces sp. NPDC060198]
MNRTGQTESGGRFCHSCNPSSALSVIVVLPLAVLSLSSLSS